VLGAVSSFDFALGVIAVGGSAPGALSSSAESRSIALGQLTGLPIAAAGCRRQDRPDIAIGAPSSLRRK